MDFRLLSGNEVESEPLISSREKLSGFSIVTATEFGAMNEKENREGENKKRNGDQEELDFLVLRNVCHYIKMKQRRVEKAF